jgi:hypothetical protein
MAIVHFTEYEVRQLMVARKFIFHVIRDNVQSPNNSESEKQIVYDIRRRDTPRKDYRLRLCARLAPSLSGVGPKSTPGVSLQWRGKNIRKLDYALRHDSIRSSVSAGHVSGWHEHIWTDEDEDRYVIAADPPVKGTDIRSLVRWATEKWNIETDKIAEQFILRS